MNVRGAKLLERMNVRGAKKAQLPKLMRYRVLLHVLIRVVHETFCLFHC